MGGISKPVYVANKVLSVTYYIRPVVSMQLGGRHIAEE
jgi:hypothetical protein